MKSQLLKVMVLMAAFTGLTVSAFAGSSTITFGAKARLPQATAFECVMSKGFDANGTITFSPYGSTSLDFGDLKEAAPAAGGLGYGWWKSPLADFFVCDLKPVGGVGIPTVKLSYAEGANPNEAAGAPYNRRHGLGYKGVMTVVPTKAGSGGATTDLTPFGKTLFKDIGSITTSVTTLIENEAWVRMYMGLVSIPASGNIEQPGGEAFTGFDHYGEYTGTITATVTW